MKTKNLISSLLCSLLVLSGQQAFANTVHSNQSNSTTSGLNYVETGVVKLAKQADKATTKNEEKAKVEVKEETKKDEVKEVKEETKKDEVKEVKEETKKDEVKEVKVEVKKDEVKEVKEETKKDEVKEVKEETKKDEVKEVKEETKKDEVKEVKEETKKDDKNDNDDGTNPLSFENLVSNDHSDNNHCKSKKGNECNVGDNHDEDSHHNGDDDDEDEHEISPVPIPGAIWLFGTALMGFISMSSRRKV